MGRVDTLVVWRLDRLGRTPSGQPRRPAGSEALGRSDETKC